MSDFLHYVFPGAPIPKEKQIAREILATLKMEFVSDDQRKAVFANITNETRTSGNKIIGKTEFGNFNIYKIDNASDIKKYSIFAVARDNSDVLAVKENNVYHSDMIKSIHPGKNVDDYVRFVINSQGEISTDTGSAGIVISTENDKTKAINSIYKALDHLTNTGLSNDEKVVIFTTSENGQINIIRTTAKEFIEEYS